MAHFAQIDKNNSVLQVIVIGNKDCENNQGQECEQTGVAFCKDLFGEDTLWKQTSYNTSAGKRYDPTTREMLQNSEGFRGNYAGIGFTYNEQLDAFLPPQPYPSWIIDEENFTWKPPIDKPTESKKGYYWNEQTLNWEENTGPFPSWIWNDDYPRWEPPIEYPEDGNDYRWSEDNLSWILIEEE